VAKLKADESSGRNTNTRSYRIFQLKTGICKSPGDFFFGSTMAGNVSHCGGVVLASQIGKFRIGVEIVVACPGRLLLIAN
jgi:superfamily II DNA/RNA helicase